MLLGKCDELLDHHEWKYGLAVGRSCPAGPGSGCVRAVRRQVRDPDLYEVVAARWSRHLVQLVGPGADVGEVGVIYFELAAVAGPTEPSSYLG
jgi:hypothetical protein